MKINNINDLIKYIEDNPNHILCSYSGDWIVYKEDENGNTDLINDIHFNNLMMKYLEDLNLLSFKGYVISHRSVRQYKIENLDKFQIDLNKILFYLKDILNKCKDEKFKSIKHLVEFLTNIGYEASVSKIYYRDSFWKKFQEIQSMTIHTKNNDTYTYAVHFPYYSGNSLRKDGFYSILNEMYINLKRDNDD